MGPFARENNSRFTGWFAWKGGAGSLMDAQSVFFEISGPTCHSFSRSAYVSCDSILATAMSVVFFFQPLTRSEIPSSVSWNREWNVPRDEWDSFFKIGRSWVVDELFSSTENPSFRDVCLQNKADCSNSEPPAFVRLSKALCKSLCRNMTAHQTNGKH